ncbi:hypothetical protein ACIQVK_45155 [Streptomyces sp. NPDC090493]|uniref:hypothetical protein n=1 Tax=Streptomyces sp. NPDC090493 TaxID=3365964 RepID=UPI00382B8B54
MREILAPLLSHADTVRAADEIHHRLHTLDVRDRHVRAAKADLPLKNTTAARALGRLLTRTSTSTLTVDVGIALLARLGEPEDVPCLAPGCVRSSRTNSRIPFDDQGVLSSADS